MRPPDMNKAKDQTQSQVPFPKCSTLLISYPSIHKSTDMVTQNISYSLSPSPTPNSPPCPSTKALTQLSISDSLSPSHSVFGPQSTSHLAFRFMYTASLHKASNYLQTNKTKITHTNQVFPGTPAGLWSGGEELQNLESLTLEAQNSQFNLKMPCFSYALLAIAVIRNKGAYQRRSKLWVIWARGQKNV